MLVLAVCFVELFFLLVLMSGLFLLYHGLLVFVDSDIKCDWAYLIQTEPMLFSLKDLNLEKE